MVKREMVKITIFINISNLSNKVATATGKMVSKIKKKSKWFTRLQGHYGFPVQHSQFCNMVYMLNKSNKVKRINMIISHKINASNICKRPTD